MNAVIYGQNKKRQRGQAFEEVADDDFEKRRQERLEER